MAFKKSGTSMVETAAIESATKAAEEGLNVLVLRFNEKLTDVNLSGSPAKGLNAGIAAVEGTGNWKFESLTVDRDERTLGDRMAFFAVFRRM